MSARSALGWLLALATFATPAGAAVPSASNSTVPSCFVACPMGDLHIVVVVRDFANDPVGGATVILDFLTCPGAFICTSPPSDPYLVNLPARNLRLSADAQGRADFPLRVGGECGGGSVRVFADGVLLGARALASPDQDGDGLTANPYLGSDDPSFGAKLGTNDPSADFDCDGVVDGGDEAFFRSHAMQSCEGRIVPAQRRSWGRLKSFYR